jgi:hypothetical protein
MKTYANFYLLVSLLAAFSTSTNAETLSFQDIWKQIAEKSPAQEAAKLKTLSTEEGLSRAERHWLPKLYLDARSYSTNDPSSAFVGLLEQRKVETADFNPDALNHPDAQSFTRGAVGIDLPLYEGGMKQAQVFMYDHLLSAQKLGKSQIEVEQYAQSASAYATIALIEKQKAKLTELSDAIAKLMKSYQLGQKTNPVGYSGLLGMRSLANRITGLIEHLGAQKRSYFAMLKELGVRDENWAPQTVDAREFADRFLNSNKSESYTSMAGAENAQASFQAAKMERARYLPKVGAFAESYMFSGNRDTANGYTAGLYLQWSLFDPADFGKYKQAKLSSLAGQKFVEASSQEENAERQRLMESKQALRSNLSLLDESDKLLSEQTRVSSTLFKNGSINVLQFVEILNRRTDLIAQQTEAEMNLVKTAAALTTKTKFEIPENINRKENK